MTRYKNAKINEKAKFNMNLYFSTRVIKSSVNDLQTWIVRLILKWHMQIVQQNAYSSFLFNTVRPEHKLTMTNLTYFQNLLGKPSESMFGRFFTLSNVLIKLFATILRTVP